MRLVTLLRNKVRVIDVYRQKVAQAIAVRRKLEIQWRV
jgi:hypothetical protein